MAYEIDSADIAIVGMAGQFPGATDLGQFWDNLRAGVESITFLTNDDIRAAGIDPAVLNDPHFVKAAARLDDIAGFDAAFFDIPPREAEIIDPQHRLFLECAWTALEHAGYAARTYPGAIGVYAGATINTYLLFNLASNTELLNGLDPLQINIGNGSDFLTTRVSYKLNLKGTSHVVQSACSTSLVAVHSACQSLLNEECDLALAGGVSVNVSQRHGYHYVEGGMASPDGHCRTFDAAAQGTIFGNGVGAVVLKRLEDALRDGDTVHAVIKGSATNNDGAAKVGYTAPSVDGQAQVITEALANAGISANSVSYVEAHGTATPLGDPIEVAALTKAFRASTKRQGFCAIGSLKSNIGHLDAAAGVTGLIKVVLMLKHREVPPTLHFEQPNPNIDFASSPFVVNARLTSWPESAMPRRAGVSSFGVGGTNAHVIVQEAPRQRSSPTQRSQHVVVLSARTRSALDTMSRNLHDYLVQHQEYNLADIAYTLQTGRQVFEHRRALVCRDVPAALAALRTDEPGLDVVVEEMIDRPVAFLFPGQGAQYVNMARELYEHEPVMRATIDRCAEILRPQLRQAGVADLRDVLFPAEQAGSSQIDQTALTQPALFVIEYALAQLWMSWGIQPQALIGHSIGEYVAACLADVLSLEDALALIALRGQLMQNLPSGMMLAVPLTEEDIQFYLSPEVALAAVNGPSQCVLSGTTTALEEVQQQLAAIGIQSRRLQTSHAFHSPMMQPIVTRFTDELRRRSLRVPRIPFISNVSGTWITPEQATNPDYWAMHLREPVRFADGLATLLAEPERLLLEVGPRQSLSRLVKRHPQYTTRHLALSSLQAPQPDQSETTEILQTLGRLWQAGVLIQWSNLYPKERRQRIPLPTYPFEHQHYWIERQAAPTQRPEPVPPSGKQPDPSDWLYQPSWKRAPLPQAWPKQSQPSSRKTWLVFLDGCDLGVVLAERLEQLEQLVVRVEPGPQWRQLAPDRYMLNPASQSDYIALWRALETQECLPDQILHLWSVTPDRPFSPDIKGFKEAQETGFLSLVWLAQALATSAPARPCTLWVVSNQVHDVTGSEVVVPGKATLLGPCKVIPQEYPQIICRSIDVIADPASAAHMLDHLLAELRETPGETTIAYRGRHRWAQTFEPVRLAQPHDTSERIRRDGVYLISDGLREIGFALCQTLAQHGPVTLVLIEETALPPRAQWSNWLSHHPASDAISQRIGRVRELEAQGAMVELVEANVANLEQMQAVVTRYPVLHGVIHAAKAKPEQAIRAIAEIGPAEIDWHFRPRVYGALILAHLLRDRALDFFVVVSGLSSVLGGVGSVAYASANLSLNSLVQQQTTTRQPWISIDWESWQLGDEFAHPGARGSVIDRLALTVDEGRELFLRIVEQFCSGQIVVSTGPLADRINHWIKTRPLDPAPEPGSKPAPVLHPRPQLKSAYVAPATDLQRKLTELWQQALGIAPIGVQDNFFDLGGDSLVALQVSANLKKELAINIPVVSLYEGLTVQALADLIQSELPNSAAPVDGDESPGGRESRNVRRKQLHEKQRTRRRDERGEDDHD